jgi:hypothetical protein
MSTILTRCRDADMMGPVCDVIAEGKPIDETIKEMRINAKIHNEPDITDDVADLEELLTGADACCMDECCC